jgi:hypothetical protein
MDFQVFLKSQDHRTDTPLHRGTRTVVKIVLAAGLARLIGQNAIKLTTSADWKQVKVAARTHTMPTCRTHYIPDKLPPVEVGGCQFKLVVKTPPSHLRLVLIPHDERVLGY